MGSMDPVAKPYDLGFKQCDYCVFVHPSTWACSRAQTIAEDDHKHSTLEHKAFTRCKYCGLRHDCADASRIPCEEFRARLENKHRLATRTRSMENTWWECAISGESHYQAIDRLETAIGYALKTERTYSACSVCKGTGLKGHIRDSDGKEEDAKCSECLGTGVEPRGSNA